MSTMASTDPKHMLLGGHLAHISLLSILLIFASALIVYYLWRAFASPLRDIPGPYAARFTRLWKLWQYKKGDFHKTNIELHRTYGSIVRIAPNQFSIDDPEAVKVIYGIGGGFRKSTWYTASGLPSSDPHAPISLFTELNPSVHANARRKVAALYSMTALTEMEALIDSCSAILTTRFHEFAATNEVIDMAHWLQCYAFDVIGEITLAARFGFLDEGKDISGIIAAIDGYLNYVAGVGVYSEYHSLIMKAKQLLPQKKGGIMAVHEFTSKQIQSRTAKLESGKVSQKGDFLGKMLELHVKNPENIRKEDVFMACATNIGAGSDTTSISLSSVIYHLCKYPRVVHVLRDEIAHMEALNTLSDPITFKETQKMPYLQAVIKEALRCHPATGFPLERVIPKGGATIAGRDFPAGAIVGINSWVAHANTDVFGLDASTFRPERWLDKELASRMERYFFTFGQGSRTCIGKNISLLEMAKLIPQLVRNFDFELQNPEQDWQTQNEWFVKQKSFRCRIKVARK